MAVAGKTVKKESPWYLGGLASVGAVMVISIELPKHLFTFKDLNKNFKY
jgi:hypothetical protein